MNTDEYENVIDYEGLIRLYFGEFEAAYDEDLQEEAFDEAANEDEDSEAEAFDEDEDSEVDAFDEAADEDEDSEVEAFDGAEEEWQAWSRFVDLLCAILLMQKEAKPSQALNRVGCLLTDEELMLALEPRKETRFPAWNSLRKVYSLLLRKTFALSDPEIELPLGRILRFGLLESMEWMAFLLALCVHRNRKYERIFGVLQEQMPGIVMPTVGLVVDMCRLFMTEEETDPSLLLDSDTFLNRILLTPVPVPEGLSRLSTPLMAGLATCAYATNSEMGLGNLIPYASELFPEEDSYICHEDLLEELSDVYVGMSGFQDQGIVFLEGEEGTGRTFLIEQLAAITESGLLTLSMSSLMAGGKAVPESLMQEAVRRCYFKGEMLYLKDVPSEPLEQRAAMEIAVRFLRELGSVFISGRRFQREAVPGGVKVYLLKVPFPDMRAQKHFWEIFNMKMSVRYDEDVDINQLVSKYNMPPGLILDTLRAARMHGEIGEETVLIGREIIEKEIRGSSLQNFGEYASKLEPAFSWEDLLLPEESSAALLQAMDRVRYKSIVNEDFGFSKKLPYGGGVSIVLYGPPGTGKTMAAQVVARELGLDIYRIDLSQIESKYIGETSKNLGRIFEAARYSNAILFFDEADALFAKRTEVSDSNDRHANAETAYLLQKIEEYSGVSILATNVFNNFDDAFKRRMTFLIPLRWPEEAERLRLWKSIFPAETPLAKDVNLVYCAKIEDMTGSSIKTAAVAAAYKAAREHRAVTQQDIMTAIRDEYRKKGRTMRLPEDNFVPEW